MRDTLTLLLPVLWAAVATGIGLLLYKTSKALFEQSGRKRSATKRLRLTGSVVIAALAFWGMKMSTPIERLRATDRVVGAKLDEIQRATLEAEAALTVGDSVQCKGALARIARAAADLRHELNEAPSDNRPARQP